MCSGDFKKTGVERVLCWVHASTFEKAHQFRNLLDNLGNSEGGVIIFAFTFYLYNCYFLVIYYNVLLLIITP